MKNTIKTILFILLPIIMCLVYPHMYMAANMHHNPMYLTIFNVVNIVCIILCLVICKDVKYKVIISLVFIILFGSHLVLIMPIPDVIKIPFMYLQFVLGKSREVQLKWLVCEVITCIVGLIQIYKNKSRA